VEAIRRTFDPNAGEDQGGKGVASDVAVTADMALEGALRHIG